MARQNGVIQFTGKLGRVVGMKNGFSETTNKVNFMREKVDEIANPQSDLQMNQRAKMLPAVLFRRQLEEVISRAWEGVKYGGPSTRKFMKYALKEPWTNIPQLPKDSTLPIPGSYLISQGSLPTIGMTLLDSSTARFNISLDEFTGGTQTVGAFTTDALTLNPFLREGDQLTFIIAYTPSYEIPYVIYKVGSVYLDSTSNVTFEEAVGFGNSFSWLRQQGELTIDADQTLLGAAVVLSREGSSTHQRSTERFRINSDGLLSDYFAQNLKTSIAETYRTGESTRSIDWPYQEGGIETDDGTTATISVSISLSAAGTVAGAGRYTTGDTVTLRATPATGYNFQGWKSGGTTLSTDARYSFTAAASMNIVATFIATVDPD